MRANADRLMAIGCFGLACAIGLVGAFVGLETHGFWFDELFTAQILAPDGASRLIDRIATDVHPPVYLVALSLYSKIFGAGDAALRSFSAVSACGAIVVFVAATRQAFSLPARLFGAALATGSLFWFFQSQNARSYALCLLFGAIVLALCLTLVDGKRRPDLRLSVGMLLAVMLVGSFVHFYVMYECLAALIVLALLRRDLRYVLIAAAAVLLVAAALYVKLVVTPFTQVALGNNWYPNNPTWYFLVLKSCVQYSFGGAGLVAIALCTGALVFGRATSARIAPDRWRPDPAIVLLVGVPVLVLIGGIASSTLLAPNFFDRNFLVLSPFIWGLSAKLYDGATADLSRLVRIGLNIALVAIVVPMASIVTLRLPSEDSPPLYEPYRQSAAWIRTLPECQGQIVPVISPDSMRWYKPGYAELIYAGGYGRYLHGFARPRLLFTEEIAAHRLPPDLIAELQRRLAGDGCPVLAWSAHNMSDKTMAAAAGNLLLSLNRSATDATVKTKEFHDGSVSFVFYRAP